MRRGGGERRPRHDSLQLTEQLAEVEIDRAKEFHQEVAYLHNDLGVQLYDRYRTYYAAGDERVDF